MDQAATLKVLNTALEHHRAGRLNEAETIYRRVLTEQPNNVDALHLMGVIHTMTGRAPEGVVLMQRAAVLLPQFGENLKDLALCFTVLGRPEEAVAAYLQALRVMPRDGSLRSDLATALFTLNRQVEALEQMHAAVNLEPNNPIIVANYGFLLTRAGQTEAGIATLRRAVEIDPNCAPAWCQLAEGLWRATRYSEAVAPARRAAELLPNDARMLLIYGNTLQTGGDLELAAKTYRRCIELDPNTFDQQNNLALTLLKLGDAREAAAHYEKILARWPGMRDAIANQSLTLLTLGDFEHGFEHYEARGSLNHLEVDRRAGRLWDGSDPRGKTMFLASEQGFGDTIHFVRYASLIAERGATVIAGCPPELVPVVSTVRGLTQIVPVGAPMPKYDLVAPMGSLPRLMKTRVETIPGDVPYMSAEPARVEQWRTKFADDPNVKVGIAWSGSSLHQNDRARSSTLAAFAPLARVPGVSLYSVQKGGGAKELDSPPEGMKVTSLGPQLKDFADTAALLEALDLLISVDTSVVHMAGALGRPVWTLIARGPDWRWMIEREDTPWYPTMRLFRQTKLHDWPPVLERIAVELEKFVTNRQKPTE